MRISRIFPMLLALALTACGGGSDDAFQGGTGGTGGSGTAPVVAAVTAITSTSTVPSDGANPAEISVFVRNANNQFMAGVPVIFSASSGGLQITQATTDANGLAKATLIAAGDPTNRTITVTAQAGTITQTVRVDVVGTVLTVQGPTALTVGQRGTYTLSLLDAGGKAISARAVTITSSRSNTLSAASVTTDFNGRATFTMTAAAGGNDTLSVAALGQTAQQAVAVNADSFTYSSPAANTEITLGSAQAVTVVLLVNGVPQAGQTISFSTTRGSVTPVTAVTDAAGRASTTVTAANAGAAIISATAGASTAQLALEFVATVPTAIDVQPSSFAIATAGTSTVTAVVRDAQGNLVKGRTVVFTLDDVTGGTLSTGSVVTDSQGRAQTVYTASNTTSANEGVKITATVQGVTPTLARQVALTVARREVFISLGTGNEITEPNTAQYRKEYIVQVTDSNGNGVANVPVSMRILSEIYHKGYRASGAGLTPPITGWLTFYTLDNAYAAVTGCRDEDVNRNGVLDANLNEDFNNSGRIEAGNIAAVTPSNVTTDANGFALVVVSYPQEYAYYLQVALSASATVQGTEYVRTNRFMLEGSAEDFRDVQKAAPGPRSPFGVATTCSNPN
jgi:Bacterial Ig-like domain (group 1)